jgi:hypothetical protein
MLRKSLLFVFIASALTACVLPATTSVPTPYPAGYLPTVIYLTAQSINATRASINTPTLAPTEISTETLTPVVPTLAPTITLTPAPGDPLAQIQINEPGPMSRVVSPLEVQLFAISGDSGQIAVDLFGEDGTHLGSSSRRVSGGTSGDFLSIKIRFEIRAAGETGIVQVSTKDAVGRIQSLNSVRVLLLSSGASQINPAGNAIYERVVFYHLNPRAVVSGGVLSLQGRYTPMNHKITVLELVTSDGKIFSRVLTFPNLDSQSFNTTIPYKVSEPTEARLFLYQDDDVIDGRAYVYSQEITLNP